MKVFSVMKDWDFLLSEFRKLGGIANNICQKEGRNGRGIFSVDPSKTAKIFTPAQLMVKTEDIYLEENKLRIKKDREYSQEIRNFFNFYQDNYSWGSGGKETTELFEKGLSLFNSNLRELLKKYALVDIDERHKGEWNIAIKNQFLHARGVKFGSNTVIAPIWELVNHKVKSLPFFISKEGLGTPNYPASKSEIRFSYNNLSPLHRFFSYGFFSEETIIWSIPFTIYNSENDINIICKGIDFNNDSMRIERSSNEIILDGLPIVDVNYPRLPYEYFDEIIRKININNFPRNLLLKIFELNLSVRKEIIRESRLIDNEVFKSFSEVLDYEINLIESQNLNYMNL